MGETVSEPVRVKAQRANDDDGWGWTIDVTAPDGARSLYQLPQALDPTDDPDAFGDALTAARTEAGMPDDADPLDDGWSVSAGMGKPHPATLSRSRLVDWSEGVPSASS
jgi:hypothetical protein